MVAGAAKRRKESPADDATPSSGDYEPEQGDLFRCEVASLPIKEDLTGMEFPIFSLSKNKDLETREYRRGNRTVKLIPSSVGAPTVFDKDLLLYIASQIVNAKNQGKPISPIIEIDACDFLVETERGDGRASFERIMDMLHRLRGAILDTNIETGGIVTTEPFSLIKDYKVISQKSRTIELKGKRGKSEERQVQRVIKFYVEISDWMFRALSNLEVLTLDRGYFRLTRSIERRLYELARKHCGDQALWSINIDLLAAKVGTGVSRAKFRAELREAIQADALPEYRIALDSNAKPDDVVFYTRSSPKLAKYLLQQNRSAWFAGLERADNTRKKQPAIADV